jgi:hypothetical protein
VAYYNTAEAALTKKEVFGLTLAGAAVVFVVTTIIAKTGLAMSLGEDEDILVVLRTVSLLVAIGAGIGLTLP